MQPAVDLTELRIAVTGGTSGLGLALVRHLVARCRVGDIVIFDVLGAAPRGSGATEAAARDAVRRVAAALKTPYEDFNGEAFLVVPG